MFGRKKKEVPVVKTGSVIPEEVQADFKSYMETMKKATGKTDVQILHDTFADGWLSVFVEETGANLKIDASQLFAKPEATTKDPIEEYMRLRKNFAPVASCVDYIIQQLIGGGIDVIIKNAKDKPQKTIKEELEVLVENVYQDDITVGLNIILPILIDYSLVTGVGAAEITYNKDVSFWEYATVEKPSIVTIDKKDIEVVSYAVKIPDWKSLNGLKRLKIIPDAYKRIDPQRNMDSWEIQYWIVDNTGKDAIKLSNGTQFRKFDRQNPKAGKYLHNWQLFWLALNRKEFGAKAESIIAPVYSISLILEKILGAVGEGIYRAGNKKYFIVMGDEKRPWGGPFIRNVLQQMKESKEKNWSVIPMPMGFDIKEMGGTVFDAKDVVEYFLKTIAKGMNCPAKTLGVEVREEESFSYQIYKTNLLSAIKNQLFKRHVWSLHGNKKIKQGGSEGEAFIPNPRIKTEELLSLKERIKLFQDLQNVANPINPVTKLKSEIELCKVLGWDDVITELPTLEEYAKELAEAKKQMEEKLNAQLQDTSNPLGEKTQGQPKAQTLDQQNKRLEGMKNKGQSKKGQSKGLGGPRVNVNETGEEIETEETEDKEVTIPKIPIEVTVKTEYKPQEVIVKTESTPQKIEIESKTPALEAMMKDIAEKQKEFSEKQLELTAKQKEVADVALEENKAKKEKTVLEIEKLKTDINSLKAEIDANEAKSQRLKIESEEIKKTHEKKREAIEKITEEAN